MSISPTVKKYLTDHEVRYDVIPHTPTASSMQTAEAAHVPGGNVAKAVVLEDEDGYLMAIMPANYKLAPNEIYDVLGRHLHMVPEKELGDIFTDCDLGAVPPLASAYGMPAVWDDSLANVPEVFFEGGDHGHLVRVAGTDFRALMADARHAHFSHHV